MNRALYLQLLGGFGLSIDEQPIGVGGGRLQALLAYLVLHPQAPQSRQQIAVAFWADAPEAQGRNNLRQLLHQLRQAWPEHDRFVASDARSMQWRDSPGVRVDVIEFERELATTRPARRADRRSSREALVRVARAYAGALLPDCYDEWIGPHRERLHRGALSLLDRIVRSAEEDHDHATAVVHAERLLALDPLEERTYLRLMRLHALNGDRTAARSVYTTCVMTLQRELGVAPGEEIRDAHQRLMRRGSARAEPPRNARPAGRETEHRTALVGRASEWQALEKAWRDIQPNAAVLALITGEAGLGKTRLGEEMLHWADAQGIAVAATRAYAAEGRLAFSPIAGWLRSEPLRESLTRLDPLWRTEVARLLPELLVEQPDLPRPAPLAEYWQRQQFFEALARAVTGAAPALVLLMDDLQWCDNDTLEWLHYLLRFTSNARLLVVGTVRIEEVDAQHPIGPLTTALRRADRLIEIPLTPLDAAETARLATAVAGADLDVEAAFRLFSQTEGNPLFVVETVRAGLPTLRSCGDTAAERTLPPKIQAVINWRLNQLSPEAREVAGLAATIGRAFSIDILSAASNLRESSVARALDELWQRRIVRDRGPGADARSETWDFTHDRLREVASAEPNPLQRQRSHGRIAEALERLCADDLDAVSARIASHYDQARDAARALPYYERAARVAARVFAYEEVQMLLRRALSLLERHPEASRATLELPLQFALGAAIRVTSGWASPALEAVNARVVELTRSVGDAEQQAIALLSSICFSEVRAEYHRVQMLLAEVPAALVAVTSPALRVMASTVELGAHLHQGRFAEAEAVYLASAHIYDSTQHRAHVEIAGADFGVLGSAWSSHGLFCQGSVDAAFDRCHEALTLARSLGHPFSKALALTYLSTLHQMNGDVEYTRLHAAEALAVSERHRVLYYGAWASVMLAWVDASSNPADDSRLPVLRQRIEELTATGTGQRLPYFLSLLAGLQTQRDGPAAALATVDEALRIASERGDAWWEAELHRTRGEILARCGDRATEAHAELVRAVAIAHGQGARLLEQRARESLGEFGSNGHPNA